MRGIRTGRPPPPLFFQALFFLFFQALVFFPSFLPSSLSSVSVNVHKTGTRTGVLGFLPALRDGNTAVGLHQWAPGRFWV